jgi:hypothetical protein
MAKRRDGDGVKMPTWDNRYEIGLKVARSEGFEPPTPGSEDLSSPLRLASLSPV